MPNVGLELTTKSCTLYGLQQPSAPHSYLKGGTTKRIKIMRSSNNKNSLHVNKIAFYEKITKITKIIKIVRRGVLLYIFENLFNVWFNRRQIIIYASAINLLPYMTCHIASGKLHRILGKQLEKKANNALEL